MNEIKLIKNSFQKESAILLLLFFPAAIWIAINDHAPMLWKVTHPFSDAVFGVVNQEFPGPLVYRIMLPYTVSFLHDLFPMISYVKFDFGIKVMILSGIQFSFFRFLRNFFTGELSLLGVLWLDLFIDYCLSFFLGSNIFESADLMNILFMSLALQFLYKKNLPRFYFLLFIGMFNRETVLILLVPVMLGYFRSEYKFKVVLFTVLALVIPFVGIRLAIHPASGQHFLFDFIKQNFPYPGNPENLFALKSLFRFGILLGPVIILAAYKFRKKTPFLLRTGTAFILLLLLHFLVGRIIESRLWMPAFILLIPLALETIRTIFSGKEIPELRNE